MLVIESVGCGFSAEVTVTLELESCQILRGPMRRHLFELHQVCKLLGSPAS